VLQTRSILSTLLRFLKPEDRFRDDIDQGREVFIARRGRSKTVICGKQSNTIEKNLLGLKKHLRHVTEQVVNLVVHFTTLDEVVGLLVPPTGGCVQLEGPHEVVGILEVRPDGKNFVNEVLNADGFARLDDVVFSDGVSATVQLCKWASSLGVPQVM
jgi:hypothetical protein